MSSLRSKGDYTVVLLAIARDMLLWLRNQCLQDSDSRPQPLEFKDLISKCDDVLQKARQYLECIASELTIRLLRLSLTHVSKMKQAIVCAMLSAYNWLALWQNATCGKLLPLQLLVPLLKSAWPKHKGRRSSSTLFKSVGPSARDQFPTMVMSL